MIEHRPIKGAFDQRERDLQRRFATPESLKDARAVVARAERLIDRVRARRDERIKKVVKQKQAKPVQRLIPKQFAGRLLGENRKATRDGIAAAHERAEQRTQRILQARDNQLQRIEQRRSHQERPDNRKAAQPGRSQSETANVRRAALQNARHEAEGEQGRRHTAERLALETEQDRIYGGSLKTSQQRLTDIAARQERKGIQGAAYRLSGAAERDRSEAADLRAGVADIEQRKAEQRGALAVRQAEERETLAASHDRQAGELERSIERDEGNKQAGGGQQKTGGDGRIRGAKPEQKNANNTKTKTGGEAERDEGADFSPVERGDFQAGETASGNEQAHTATPEAAGGVNSGAGEQTPPPGWSSEAERQQAISEARERREAGEHAAEHSNDDTGRSR